MGSFLMRVWQYVCSDNLHCEYLSPLAVPVLLYVQFTFNFVLGSRYAHILDCAADMWGRTSSSRYRWEAASEESLPCQHGHRLRSPFVTTLTIFHHQAEHYG